MEDFVRGSVKSRTQIILACKTLKIFKDILRSLTGLNSILYIYQSMGITFVRHYTMFGCSLSLCGFVMNRTTTALQQTALTFLSIFENCLLFSQNDSYINKLRTGSVNMEL